MIVHKKSGFAVVTALLMLVVLGVLATTYFAITNIEMSTSNSSVSSATGFYAAEAGLNLRGQAIRSIFEAYSSPQGVPPVSQGSCTTGNMGGGDFACQQDTVNERQVVSYVQEGTINAAGGDYITLSQGPFAGLSAIEHQYHVFSQAINPGSERPEAMLEMVFRSQLIPMFQFAAFYNKDLEIAPGPNMTLDGRVHVNGDLYLNSGAQLAISGQVTASSGIFRGTKRDNGCSGTVRVSDDDASTNPDPAMACSGGRTQLTNVFPWNGRVEYDFDLLVTPPIESFDPDSSYWQDADLRVVLNTWGAAPQLEVRAGALIDKGVIPPPLSWAEQAMTAALNTCTTANGYMVSAAPYAVANAARHIADPGTRAVEFSLGAFFNNRENRGITLLEVDVEALMACISANEGVFGFPLSDTTHGGLVWYFTVLGQQSDNVNNAYGVRVRNGADLADVDNTVRGLTIVTDQALYVQGDYNRDGANWRPASFLTDSLNVLSNGWNELGKDDRSSETNLNNRRAMNTEINAAFLSGTDTTGGVEGSAGRGGAYNGGLENYPRFHENWSSRTLTYRGSFVSLSNSRYVNGPWRIGGRFYNAPTRNWGYDTRFNFANQLPPLSPRFVRLQQEVFVRDFGE